MPDEAAKTPPIVWREGRREREGAGRRVATPVDTPRGSYVRSRLPVGPPRDVALDATVRAAAMRGGVRPGADPVVQISSQDIRVKSRRRRTGTAVLFVVDSSGSMGLNRRMSATKGAVLSLLNDAYQRRDRVALIAFRGEGASVALPFTASVDLAERLLADLPTGGKTPLASGLLLAQEMFVEEERRRPKMNRLLVLITDGRANVSEARGDPLAEVQAVCSAWCPKDARRVVVDTETGMARFGRARRVSEWLGADYLRLDELTAQGLAGAVSVVLRG